MAKIDVDQAMQDNWNGGYNGLEIPGFYGDEPLLVFYHPEILSGYSQYSQLLDVIPSLGNDDNAGDYVIWNDVQGRTGVIDLGTSQQQEEQTVSIDISIIDDNGEKVLAAFCFIAVEDIDSVMFSYADMLDAAIFELRDMGIVGDHR